MCVHVFFFFCRNMYLLWVHMFLCEYVYIMCICVFIQDPNAEHVEVSDWNKYAEEEYDILVADEGNADLEEGWVTS